MRIILSLLACAAIAGCSGEDHMLNPLSASDTALIEPTRGKPGPDTCGLARKDGHIVLLSMGGRAVVNLGGKPTVLNLQSNPGTTGRTYGNGQLTVALSFVADASDAKGDVIAQEAGVVVTSTAGWEHFYALWTC